MTLHEYPAKKMLAAISDSTSRIASAKLIACTRTHHVMGRVAIANKTCLQLFRGEQRNFNRDMLGSKNRKNNIMEKNQSKHEANTYSG